MRALAAAVLVVLLAVPAAPAVSATKPTRVQKLARSLVAQHAPGAVVFVRTPKGIHSAAAGAAQLQPRVPMRVADHYRIASLTKTFVATAVLQLVAEGKLGLDDPVEQWLPGVVPNGAEITIRQLLSHTSGLFNYTDDQSWEQQELANPGHVWLPMDLLRIAFSHDPLFAPGANWSYSNTGYIVIGLVIERVTGKPVGDVLRERIFEPLGLSHTSFPSGLAVPEPFAHGYLFFGGALLDLTPLLDPSWAYAAAQIVSTAADVTKFYSALLGGRLLSPALLAQMKAGSGVSGVYGLGLQTVFAGCGRVYGHEGNFFGWRNFVFVTANGRRAAAVIVNVDESRLAGNTLQAVAIAAVCTG